MGVATRVCARRDQRPTKSLLSALQQHLKESNSNTLHCNRIRATVVANAGGVVIQPQSRLVELSRSVFANFSPFAWPCVAHVFSAYEFHRGSSKDDWPRCACSWHKLHKEAVLKKAFRSRAAVSDVSSFPSPMKPMIKIVVALLVLVLGEKLALPW